MTFNKEEFARLLKIAKGDRSLNQYALHSGVSSAHISRLMRSLLDTPPNPDTIKLLAEKAYNEVSYNELMGAAGYIEDKYKIYLYAEGQSPSEDWIMLSFEATNFNIPKGTCVLGPNLPDFILEKDIDSDLLIFRIAKEMGFPDLPPNDLDKFSFMATSRLIDKIDATSFFGSAAGRQVQLSLEEITLLDELRKNPEAKITVAGQEITLSIEELRLFNELKKHPIMFHDLASDPEAKVKELIKLYKMKKMFLEEDDENLGEGFGELED